MLEELKSLFIVRLRNLGDCVLMTPALEVLRRWRPALQITVLVEEPFAAVFTNNPNITRVEVVERGNGPWDRYYSRLRAIRRLRRETYDLVWNLHGGSTSLMFTMSPQSTARLGFAHYRNAGQYTHRVPPASNVWEKTPVHTVETQLAPLKWLGLPVNGPVIPLSVYLTPEACRRVEQFMEAQQLTGKPFVLVQPTATLHTKQWHERNFAELIRRIHKEYPLEVVLAVGPREEAAAGRVDGLLRRRVPVFCGYGLEEFKALMALCSFYVGNDSGPMHLAAALKRPVVSIFGSSNFHAWHPWGTDFEAVRSDLPCIPCPGYRCYEFDSPRCIESISVDLVFRAFQRLVERHPL